MFETGREKVPTNYGAGKVCTGKSDGLCKSFRAMIVITIAMGRCAGGTQQVLVPCMCLLQLKIQIQLGQSQSEVHSWVRTCPSPVLVARA